MSSRNKPTTAKVFMSGASQAVRLPKEFRLGCKEVAIRRDGVNLIISPLYMDWDDYLGHAPQPSKDFAEAVLTGDEDLPPLQTRETFD